MRLYIVQHGQAEPSEVNPERPLTSQGTHDIQQLAVFLETHAPDISEIWHSEKLRARQTAQLLAEGLSTEPAVMEHPGLCPNDPAEAIASILTHCKSSLLLASHMPFVSHLTSLLLTNTPDRTIVSFTPGTCVCLERNESEEWSILWVRRCYQE